MIEKQLKNIFGDIININSCVMVETKKFSELFTDAKELTYDELMRVEKENNYGYEKYIEEWKEKGLFE